jgi:hypothetical protein
MKEKSRNKVIKFIDPFPPAVEKQPQSIFNPLIRAEIMTPIKANNKRFVRIVVPGIHIWKIKKVPISSSIHGSIRAIMLINSFGRI